MLKIISVTQGAIDLGQDNPEEGDAISIAVEMAYEGDVNVAVHKNSITVGRITYRFPDEIIRWLAEFESDQDVSPFTLTLDTDNHVASGVFSGPTEEYLGG